MEMHRRLETIKLLLLAAFLVPRTSSYGLRPEPPEFIAQCKRRLDLKCGNDINIYLFGRGTPFPDSCCRNLVRPGLPCHEAVITKHLLGKPKGFVRKILKKSEQLWRHCVSYSTTK
ncbi:hypothetical protein MLD38_010440 [Melastoma candidum]|uniref:Uncharacterized protein n=1 Tax=Melastoma candidum TaxID=119954 RepID=A0ACB9R2X8_9MYRT|nr:hypothetical protein MLD38_010440 [Melastoma candidum]